MSAYSSDQDLNVTDATGEDAEVDVAINLLDGNVRLSVLWTDVICLRPDDAKGPRKTRAGPLSLALCAFGAGPGPWGRKHVTARTVEP
ncbi:hypothetical protein [Streptomyces griseorubiginosus]|nr:hypothetical protein [Streptomyces griseorubiginosus]